MIKKTGIHLITVAVLFAAGYANTSAKMQADIIPCRLSCQSPVYHVNPNDISLHESYIGFDAANNKEVAKLTIGDKALDMIENADKFIVASIFLYDVFESKPPPERDIAKELADALIEKKKQNPEMTIAITLDPVNRAYNNHIGPQTSRLIAGGIDIFYTDLLTTKPATGVGIGQFMYKILRAADWVSFGIVGDILSIPGNVNIPIGKELDPKGISVGGALSSAALKANHRKILVTDAGQDFESLISSANPHNASFGFTNFAISVKGNIGKYIYMVMREDMLQSVKLGDVKWSDDSKEYQQQYFTDKLIAFDEAELSPKTPTSDEIAEVTFLTESRIYDKIIKLLKEAQTDDEIRIQMFYLSEIKVIDAILDVAKRVENPIQIILDTNSGAFGQKRDGTPNRQVAAYMLQKKKQKDLNLQIRWFESRSRQNHAKIMSITNRDAGKHQLLNGSSNWTGKNLKDKNLEANLYLENASELTDKFNQLFDIFWDNTDGIVYTSKYEGKYQKHSGMSKWKDGERWGYVSW